MFRHRRSKVIVTFAALIFLLALFYDRRLKTHFPSSTIDCRTRILPPDKNFYSHLIYIPNFNILFCDVPKAASTNLRRLIYSYLKPSDASKNVDRKQIWFDEKNFFKQFHLDENSQWIFNESNSNIFKFLLVRHPFRRIYSVFYDKFVNNQLDDTLFGWKQLEEDILREMNPNETLISIRRRDIRLDFRTFLLYIIQSIRIGREINSHWQQIVQRCAVCHLQYHWFGKIENFHRDAQILIQYLQKSSQHVELQFPSKDLDRKEKPSEQLNDSQLVQLFRRTINNQRDFQVLINYYLDDFRIFHYAIPHADENVSS